MIQDTITVLATKGWEKCLDEEECESEADLEIDEVDPLEPIKRLGARFKIPLQAAGVNVDKLHDEFYAPHKIIVLYGEGCSTITTHPTGQIF